MSFLMKFRRRSRTAAALSLFSMLAITVDHGEVAASEDPPNVLIIMADDCTFNDLPVYGGVNAKTPNIDALARDGLVFNNAYLCEAMCQPCRAALFTGQFPLRNGCAWNHSASRSKTQSIPNHLKPLGYRVGISGKVHVKPASAFPFEKVGGFDPSCVRNPTQVHDVSSVRKFMADNSAKPFCLVIALVEPHVPWVMGDASQYPPKKIVLPPNIADTDATREAYSRYLAEITYMDSQVGDILETLEATGQADNTLVLFTSEQGSQFPGCKWTNFDTGLHTALIARWPGHVPRGKRTNALVQYVDVVPTIIELAGGSSEKQSFDGRSFLTVLRGQTESHRKYAYGLHNNIPEGPKYPIRTVTNGEFRYIHNLSSDEIYIEKHLMGWTGKGRLNNPYWATWVSESWRNPEIYKLVKRYMRRPEHELYQTSTDPYEMVNLAENEDHADIQKELAAELKRWMTSQGDPGKPIDTDRAIQAARRGEHLFVAPEPD